MLFISTMEFQTNWTFTFSITVFRIPLIQFDKQFNLTSTSFDNDNNKNEHSRDKKCDLQ